jgi:pilus assembly protein Flp/PilA
MTASQTMFRRANTFLRREDAATAVEYAVMLALILMVCFSAVALFGSKTSESFSNSSNSLQSVNFGS